MPFRIRFLLFYLNYFAKKIDYSKITAPKMREMNVKEMETVGPMLDWKPLQMHHVEDEHITVRDGAQIRVRIYQPCDRTDLPIIVYYHGGGFVVRSIESHDLVCRRLADKNQALVVSVGYRLAPEFKFPTPHQDCYDATVWVVENAERLGGDKDRLIVAGDSAGGNLATVVSTLARDNNGPKIAYQVLIYPTTDARLSHPSIDKYGEGYLLSKDQMNWFVDCYKSSDEDLVNPLMSPFLQPDLADLPPAFVLTAEYDPLKDEGEAYANRMKEAGVPVIFKEYKGMVHAFANFPRLAKKALVMHEDIHQALVPILNKTVVES